MDNLDVVYQLIQDLQLQIIRLQASIDTMAVNMHQESTDSINAITPCMDSKRAYIGDTTCVFNNVRSGNINAYCEYDSGSVVQITSINRISDTVTIGFEPLEEVATVTISVL